MQGHPLHEPPRVDEDQGGPVGAGELGDAVVDLVPLLVGAHGAQLVAEHLHGQVQIAPLAHIDDGGQGAPRADQQSRGHLDGPHRGGEPDALRERAARLGHQRVQALERKGKVGAALVAGHGVDLVHDHRAHGGEAPAARFGCQEDIEGLGRRDQHMGRTLRALAPLGRRGVSGAHGGADVERADAHLGGYGAELAQRLLEVAADVIGQRPEGRDIDDLGAVFEGAVGGLADEGVQAMKEGGKRLARAGRRGEEHVLTAGDDGPAP